MDRKLGGLIAGVMLAGTAGAQDCDWRIASDRADPMTDARTCIIASKSAKIAVSVRGDDISFLTTSAYSGNRDGLTVRIDENDAIYLGNDRSTRGFGDEPRQAISQIRSGKRIRTSYRDYPDSQEGDAPICTLPELIDQCSESTL